MRWYVAFSDDFLLDYLSILTSLQGFRREPAKPEARPAIQRVQQHVPTTSCRRCLPASEAQPAQQQRRRRGEHRIELAILCGRASPGTKPQRREEPHRRRPGGIVPAVSPRRDAVADSEQAAATQTTKWPDETDREKGSSSSTSRRQVGGYAATTTATTAGVFT